MKKDKEDFILISLDESVGKVMKKTKRTFKKKIK